MKGYLVKGILIKQYSPEVQAVIIADKEDMAHAEFNRRMKAIYKCVSQVTSVEAIPVWNVELAYRLSSE